MYDHILQRALHCAGAREIGSGLYTYTYGGLRHVIGHNGLRRLGELLSTSMLRPKSVLALWHKDNYGRGGGESPKSDMPSDLKSK
jgi:hypothetical protein